MRKIFFENIYVKRPDPSQKATFENIVRQIIEAKTKSSTIDIHALEEEIDTLLYKMYKLNKDEVTLIRAQS